MMNLAVVYRLFQKNSIISTRYMIQTKEYTAGPVIRPGVKKLKKTLVAVEKKVLPVETDVDRLLTHVCGTNIYKEGGEDVKLKPDFEYPSWLWNIRTGSPPCLEEMDPNTKQYWRRLRLLGIRNTKKERTTRKF
ncbi:39S ribosomal protein L54, mitochondrial [Monomorium pharaonis]|uniref:39S ribosomal protein L54, mitochondrial n=1 Tax=Monomorium pharaonis TaxID=307658 RepID=UPI00063F156A|nr:39S ribosomal protein L54, mitochondrial [Monomorium pharaonis]